MLAYLEYDISKCWHRLKTPIESGSGTSTWKSLWSYCLFNCWPSVQVRVIKLIISPWFTTPNKTSALNAQHLSVYAVSCTVLVLIHLPVCTSLLISLISYDLPVISNWNLLSWSWRMMCCNDCWSRISPLFIVPFLVCAYCSDGMDPRLNWHIQL